MPDNKEIMFPGVKSYICTDWISCKGWGGGTGAAASCQGQSLPVYVHRSGR